MSVAEVQPLRPFIAHDAVGSQHETTEISGPTEVHADFEAWELELCGTHIIPAAPELEGFIEYNPSGLAIEYDDDGQAHYVYGVRVEPNVRADHIGTSRIVFYELNPFDLTEPPKLYRTDKSRQRDRATTEPANEWNSLVDELSPGQREQRFYADGMIGVDGEDAWVKRVWVEEDGVLVPMWYVGATYAWGVWDENNPEGLFWQERTWIVKRLDDLHPGLEPHNVGPMREKDIRRLPDGESASGVIARRPQPTLDEGLIGGTFHGNLAAATAAEIEEAPVLRSLDERADGKVPKVGSNDLAWFKRREGDPEGMRRILDLGHRAVNMPGPDGKPVLSYTAVLFEIVAPPEAMTDRSLMTIRTIGTLATRGHFADTIAKLDTERDVSNVVFPGGFPQDEQGRVVPLFIRGGREYYMVTTGLSDAACAVMLVAIKQGVLDRVAPPIIDVEPDLEPTAAAA